MQKAVINIETKEVVNIIEYSDRGLALHMPLGYTVYDCTNYPVVIGDTFEDGKFYRDGAPVEYVPTPIEEIEALKVDNESLNMQVTDLQMAIVELYETTLMM